MKHQSRRGAYGLAVAVVLGVATAHAEGPKMPVPLTCTVCAADRRVVAVNNQGHMVGVDANQAVMWTAPGQPPIVLGAFTPTALNDVGHVVGTVSTAGGLRAAIWTAESGLTSLGTLGGAESGAADVNDAGVVVGTSTTTQGWTHPFVWTTSGGMVDLGTLGPPEAVTRAVAVNSGGQVVGFSQLGTGTRGFRWSAATGLTNLGTLGGTSSVATDINGAGAIVGYSTTLTGVERGFLWTEGTGMQALVPEVPSAMTRPVAINDTGHIVGRQSEGVFLWTPTAGLARLAVGARANHGWPVGLNNHGLVVGNVSFEQPLLPSQNVGPVAWQPTWDDVVFDFGTPTALWQVSDRATTWTQVHNLSPTAMARGDLDGNHVDDLVIDFGPGLGVWIYRNRTSWTRLFGLTTNGLVIGDLDGNGQDDVVLSFPGAGIWSWENNSMWRQIHSRTAGFMAIGSRLSPETQAVANPGAELVVSFPGEGLWLRGQSEWRQLHYRDPRVLLVSQHQGVSSVVAGFSGAGVWSWHATLGWQLVHPFDARRVVAAEVDGSGHGDLIVDFGAGFGIWLYRGSATAGPQQWTHLHGSSADGIGVADLDGQGGDEVLINFGPSSGVWVFSYVRGWVWLHPAPIEGMVAGVLH